MTKSKLQHDQPGIRHANCESDTRIGPRTDLDGRPALVVFRGRSRASPPASNESEGEEHEESHVACHPSAFSCTVNRTISSRNSCHVTFFSCHISWKAEYRIDCVRLLISKSRHHRKQQQRGGGGELRWFYE